MPVILTRFIESTAGFQLEGFILMLSFERLLLVTISCQATSGATMTRSKSEEVMKAAIEDLSEVPTPIVQLVTPVNETEGLIKKNPIKVLVILHV